MARETERPIRDLMGVTRPAENQQTVEALDAAIRKTRKRFAPEFRDDIEVRYTRTMLCDMRLSDAVALAVALRDLVAQAELAAELGDAVAAWDATLSEYCDGPERDAVRALLARLDG
jgi:hypothetical protein